MPSKRILLVIGLFACVLVLSACNTSKGFGKDMEKGGEAIQNSAEKHGAD
jgi:predicted small secreted protein